MNTYWQRFPRDFGNEYQIGVATTEADGEQYAAEGYSRISRKCALREMCWRGSRGTEAYVSVTLDGLEPDDRFMFARRLRRG